MRTAALWVLGSACQSNIKMQEKLLEYGVLPRLVKPLVELNVLGEHLVLLAAFERIWRTCDSQGQILVCGKSP